MQITVKRGEQAWKVDEKGLKELPADVRPFVQRLVSSTKSPIGNWHLADPYGWHKLRATIAYPSHQKKPEKDETSRRLQDISERLKELQKAVESLKSDQ